MTFLEYGKKENPAVVLIHGMGCDGKTSFENVYESLKDKYRIILVCLDGYDNTGSIFNSISEESDKIAKFIEELSNFCNKSYFR